MSSWYDHAIIYQIYPKSFQDSNGDGIGDLNGIRQRIPYLQELGINAVWLNPVFVSPQIDNGYDVANYYAIDDQIGTMDEMEALISELHAAGIHLILDFVMNHTSDQHPWFKDASSNPDSIYRDYYIFEGHDGQKPNNWGSFFGGSVWSPDPAGTGQSYFHLFDKHMPDLNWENPEVRLSMEDIAKFWLEKGIDGLRVDAFIHIAKANLHQNFPSEHGDDEAVIAEPFYANLPNVQEWLRPFSQRIKADYPDTFLLGEAASANVNLAVDYTSKHAGMMDSVITFRYFPTVQHPDEANLPAILHSEDMDWPEFKKGQVVWQQTLANVSQPVLYWGNHDMSRMMTRVAHTPTGAKSLAMLMYLQRGIPIIYYGEELGMENLQFDTPEQFQDKTVTEALKQTTMDQPTALATISKHHKMPARGPMIWDDTAHHGFTTGQPWLDGHEAMTATVAAQHEEPTSMLTFYKQLIALKKLPIFQKGDYCLLPTDDDTFVYTRADDYQTAIVLANLSEQTKRVSIPSGEYQQLLVSGTCQSFADWVELGPQSGVVLLANN
ncbi:alpha-glucosidase [Lacticaseibacillus pabuli]|uniref:Alpha-glucosidase n=1 Tax=Lacticaseibacillus pabuli TaxID=3025672 RepID=A0ABY7WT15_9LACO|nr:alpha-glucosidase [Lacticaseibacillus sp. KACC 23028]WDF82280.1 alpha-glucosidase [Lacticaseibacillus sp. KACC 23028]